MSYSKRELTDLNVMLADMSRAINRVVAEGDANEQAWADSSRDRQYEKNWTYVGGTRAAGAMRRKSMDLTRALAELRKP